MLYMPPKITFSHIQLSGSYFCSIIPVQFKMKKTTSLQKALTQYCERAGKQIQLMRFMYNDTFIDPEDTPAKLNMEEKDIIAAMAKQHGGFGVCINLLCVYYCQCIFFP